MSNIADLFEEAYRLGWQHALIALRKQAFDFHRQCPGLPEEVRALMLDILRGPKVDHPQAAEITHQEPPQAQQEAVEPPRTTKPRKPRQPVKPYRDEPSIGGRQGLGTVDPDGGYRPPPNTTKAVPDEDDRPVFDNGRLAHTGTRFLNDPKITSRREQEEILRQAAANTAAIQREEGGE